MHTGGWAAQSSVADLHQGAEPVAAGQPRRGRAFSERAQHPADFRQGARSGTEIDSTSGQKCRKLGVYNHFGCEI